MKISANIAWFQPDRESALSRTRMASAWTMAHARDTDPAVENVVPDKPATPEVTKPPAPESEATTPPPAESKDESKKESSESEKQGKERQPHPNW